MQCSFTPSITSLQRALWLVSCENKQRSLHTSPPYPAPLPRPGSVTPNLKRRSFTCGQSVVLEDLAEHQLVGVAGEGVAEHADGHQVHVAVGAFGLVRARAVEVPLRDV